MSSLTWKILVTAALGMFVAHGATIHAPRQSNTSTISWFDCPDAPSTQCAFFDVPMDYTNINGNETVSIFLRKYPATVSEDQRLGSLLTNPGGPGGSGSEWLLRRGKEVSEILGGTYDVIGFDPRQGPPFPRHEKSHVTKLAAIQATQNAACEQNGNYEMLRNSGTVAVVKDMERIVQALGEDGLNFWGFSYGTILGATFAALKPHLVKRMVLDGVSDSESYFNDVLQWGKDSIKYSDITLRGFASTCIEAGPEYCALANKSDTTQGILDRLDALYTRLDREPLAFGDSPSGPGIIEAHHVQTFMLSSLYRPNIWQAVAQALVLLEEGYGVTLSTLFSESYGAVPRPYDQNVFNRSMQTATTREAFNPILCGDSAPLNITIDQYTDYFRAMGNLSRVGEAYATVTGRCRGWPFRAKERYTGPWKGLKTRFPILFVSLDADPVTPLATAIKMNNVFESSSLLVQQGFGHCSNAHPSLCTAKHIENYFVNGTVPPNGTHCTPEPGFIYPTNATNSKRFMLNKRDADLLSAIEKIGRTGSKYMFGL
ncbi:unnamed protein product [Rhizoctonia solani]|nr:unnamed protein product [Rhizoctonia solani]